MSNAEFFEEDEFSTTVNTNTGNDNSMRHPTTHNRLPLPTSSEAVSADLAVHAQGYSNSNNSDYSSQITTTNLLSGLAPNPTVDAVARKLYRNTVVLIGIVPHLPSIVVNNFDLRAEFASLHSKRTSITEMITHLEVEVLNAPNVPSREIFQMELDLELVLELERLAGIYDADTPNRQAVFDRELLKYERAKNATFLEINKAFVLQNKAHKDNVQRLTTLRSSRTALQQHEQLLKDISQFMRMIMVRVATALTSNDSIATPLHLQSIATKLRDKVIMENEEVVDPLGSNHLPGVVRLLYLSYCTNNLHHTFNTLIEAFSFSISAEQADSNPVAAFGTLRALSNEWFDQRFFETLTPDLFFTCIAVKSLPSGSPLRIHLVSEIINYIRRVQRREVTTSGTTPLLDEIQSTVQNYVAEQRLSAHNGLAVANVVPAASPKPQRHNYPSRYNNNYHQRQPSTGLEQAALATAAPSAAPPNRIDCGSSKFSYEVPPSSNLSHRNLPYVAVIKKSSICAQCFPDTGNGVPCANARRHYLGQCARCQHFGHKRDNCLQTVTAAGSVIP
jgi:hypothetical protein